MSRQTWKPDRTHASVRCCYTCYLRRTAKACSRPSLAQDRIEAELLAILREVAMPGGLAEAVDAALATSIVAEPKSRQASLRAFDARLERLRDMYELGDISRDEYMTKTEELRAERKTVEASKQQPVFVRQRTLCTLVDDWEYLTPMSEKP